MEASGLQLESLLGNSDAEVHSSLTAIEHFISRLRGGHIVSAQTIEAGVTAAEDTAKVVEDATHPTTNTP